MFVAFFSANIMHTTQFLARWCSVNFLLLWRRVNMKLWLDQDLLAGARRKVISTTERGNMITKSDEMHSRKFLNEKTSENWELLGNLSRFISRRCGRTWVTFALIPRHSSMREYKNRFIFVLFTFISFFLYVSERRRQRSNGERWFMSLRSQK